MNPRALSRFLVFACAAPMLVAAPKVMEGWQRTLLVGSSQLYGAMIDVDAADNLYVVGSLPFTDIVTAKLDRAGNLLWQVEFDNPGTREVGVWIDVDAFGDAVVLGELVSGANQTPSGLVVVKYGPTGNLLWANVLPMAFGHAVRVATDTAGNVVVLARAWLTNASGNTTHDFLTIKFDRAGHELWRRGAGADPLSVDNPNGLALDAAGNVFVTGGPLGVILTEGYDPSGNLLFSRQTPASGGAADLAVTSSGRVVAVSATYSQATGNQILVDVCDATGNTVWTRTYPGYASRRIAVDSRDNLVVTGYSANGYTDWITHEIAPDGALRWTRAYNQHRFNDEMPYALTIGPDDEVYVTGQGGPGPTSGNVSYLKTVTVRYSRDGAEDWVASSDLSVRGRGIVRHRDNTVSVVGESTFTVFHYGQTGVWTSTSGAIAGVNGVPTANGIGSPSLATAVAVQLGNARPGAPAALVVGSSRVNQPLLGGVLVPAPELIVPLVVAGNGGVSLGFPWPAVPSGSEVAFQFWIADPAATQGVAASNGLIGVSE